MQTEREKAELELSQMEEVAKSFNTAMKGIGTDEDRIIREISKYNNIQRQLIKSKYLTLFGKVVILLFNSIYIIFFNYKYSI
jgi:hypothetical protein